MKSVTNLMRCRKVTYLSPEIIRKWRDRSLYSFTLIEILMVAVILTLLISILLPSLQEARKKAKFVRWFAFNRALNNDPDCMINFNFQRIILRDWSRVCRACFRKVNSDNGWFTIEPFV